VCKSIFFLSLYLAKKNNSKMELAHSQISEILSNYTSSSEGGVTLQSFFNHEFSDEAWTWFICQRGWTWTMQWLWVPVVGTVMALSFLSVSHAAAVAISIWFFQAWSVARAKNVQGLSNLLYTKGLTAGQTGEISEAIYERDYSRQQVSCLTWVRRIADARVHGS